MVDFESEEARAAEFWEAVGGPADEAACARCHDGLDDYIAAQLAGADYLAEFPAVAAHLDRCGECAAAYAHLYELEAAAQAGDLPAGDPTRGPDLSFLSAESPVALLGRLVQEAGDRLRLELSEALLPLLRPAPAPLPTRSSAGQLLYRLEGAESGLPLSLAVYEDARRPALCLLEVTVAPAGESWPDLDGREVVLELGDERTREATDVWGVVIFEGVPRARLAEVALTVAGL